MDGHFLRKSSHVGACAEAVIGNAGLFITAHLSAWTISLPHIVNLLVCASQPACLVEPVWYWVQFQLDVSATLITSSLAISFQMSIFLVLPVCTHINMYVCSAMGITPEMLCLKYCTMYENVIASIAPPWLPALNIIMYVSLSFLKDRGASQDHLRSLPGKAHVLVGHWDANSEEDACIMGGA